MCVHRCSRLKGHTSYFPPRLLRSWTWGTGICPQVGLVLQQFHDVAEAKLAAATTSPTIVHNGCALIGGKGNMACLTQGGGRLAVKGAAVAHNHVAEGSAKLGRVLPRTADSRLAQAWSTDGPCALQAI